MTVTAFYAKNCCVCYLEKLRNPIGAKKNKKGAAARLLLCDGARNVSDSRFLDIGNHFPFYGRCSQKHKPSANKIKTRSRSGNLQLTGY